MVSMFFAFWIDQDIIDKYNDELIQELFKNSVNQIHEMAGALVSQNGMTRNS